MIEHFQAVVRGTTRPQRPPAASVALLAVIDRLRSAAGLGPAPPAFSTLPTLEVVARAERPGESA
jgi:hypothetical protein